MDADESIADHGEGHVEYRREYAAITQTCPGGRAGGRPAGDGGAGRLADSRCRRRQSPDQSSHQLRPLMKIDSCPKPASGIALMVVMIAVFVLSVLAGAFAYSMKVETKLAMNANNDDTMLWLGRSG